MENYHIYIELNRIWENSFITEGIETKIDNESILATLVKMVVIIKHGITADRDDSAQLVHTLSKIQSAKKSLSKNQKDIIFHFYSLGFNISANLKNFEFEIQHDLIVKNTEYIIKATNPIIIQKHCYYRIKVQARRLAGELWSLPDTKNLRTGEMAIKIHEIFIERFKDEIASAKNADEKKDAEQRQELFPKKPESIKPWLKKIAPEHAKKPGPNCRIQKK